MVNTKHSRTVHTCIWTANKQSFQQFTQISVIGILVIPETLFPAILSVSTEKINLTKINLTQHKQAFIRNTYIQKRQQKKLKDSLVASYDLQPLNREGSIL